MSRFGWAVVNSLVTGAAVIGPDLGIVVNNGGYASSSTTFRLSGSTGSLNGQLNITGSLYNTTLISGSNAQFASLTVTGITASNGRFTTLSASSTLDVVGNTTLGGNLVVNGNIAGGTINNTTIGATTQASGRFTTLSASSTLDVVGNTTLGGNLVVNASVTLGNFSTDTVTVTAQITGSLFNIEGGTINNTSIGGSTPNSGKFTTLSASSTLDVAGNTTLGGNLVVSGNVTLGNAVTDTVTVTSQITGSLFDINGGTIDNTTIGATTQSTARFTTLSASSTLNVVGASTLTTVTASSISASGGVTLGGNLVVGGNFTVSGNTIFGNAVTDTVTVTAQITGSLFDINGGTIDNTAIGVSTQSTGQFTTLSASSALQVGGNITGSNLLIEAIFGGVRTKTFSGGGLVDTTLDSDFILLYGTGTTTGTVTLHNPVQSGKILIIRKTSNANNIALTCSAGSILFDKDNSNTAGTGIVITAGTETNKMFVSNGTNWYEIFAGG